MRPTTSAERWPLVVIHWSGSVEVSDVDAHFDELTQLLDARTGRFAVVVGVDALSSPPSALVRARAGERLRRLAERFQDRLRGVAYVVPSPFLRGVITAVHWLARAEFATTVVATRAEALDWAQARVAAP